SDAWALPLRQLGSAIKGAALVGLNRPHNPTGAGMTGVQLRAVLAMCEQEGTRLISDEVYRDLAKRAAPPAALLNERAVTVGGISKPFGLGGLRLGWLATQDTTLLAALRRLRDYITLMPSGAAQRLGSIAIRHRQPLLERASLLRDRNAALLDEFLRCHHGRLRAVAPEAGCTAFVEALGVTDTKAFSRAAARQAGVLLLPGELFGRPGFVRMGFGSSTFEFGRALDKLDGWLARRAAVGDNGGSQDDQL
ncbi:MAG: aminotransferase class I/II-fold pyridoxal phosphate-dependent enzyme, partial [Chloroflexota bacterium]|nr:aminotransferase class I/II-fold pyridoxal phosphate-dependent enzyme [Chloroflexota bacterium]